MSKQILSFTDKKLSDGEWEFYVHGTGELPLLEGYNADRNIAKLDLIIKLRLWKEQIDSLVKELEE